MKRNDVEAIVSIYKEEMEAYRRYAPFDYCYNYFRTSSAWELNDEIEKSCLVLGFYLSSGSMYITLCLFVIYYAKPAEETSVK
jgi:hypothetical protein